MTKTTQIYWKETAEMAIHDKISLIKLSMIRNLNIYDKIELNVHDKFYLYITHMSGNIISGDRKSVV